MNWVVLVLLLIVLGSLGIVGKIRLIFVSFSVVLLVNSVKVMQVDIWFDVMIIFFLFVLEIDVYE